jgi:hypothetical protein
MRSKSHGTEFPSSGVSIRAESLLLLVLTELNLKFELCALRLAFGSLFPKHRSDISVTPMSRMRIPLCTGITVEASFEKPTTRSTNSEQGGSKLVVLLHPWSWLGGRMDDP